jgi:hypothetical protein
LLSLYSDPDLAATTVDRGALLETYVYQVSPDGKVIAADLKNGTVNRVRTEQ